MVRSIYRFNIFCPYQSRILNVLRETEVRIHNSLLALIIISASADHVTSIRKSRAVLKESKFFSSLRVV